MAATGFGSRMTRKSLSIAVLIATLGLVAGTPSATFAMVGGATNAQPPLATAVVTIIGSRATFCSGALIAPGVVLTAAHCVAAQADYKLVTYDAARQPRLIDVARVAVHPDFRAHSLTRHRATADVALMQITDAAALPGRPLPLGVPLRPITAGQEFIVAGVGVAVPGDGKSGGIARAARLNATGRPGTLQIRLVDPATDNTRPGLGACTGDSGGPVLQAQDGRAPVVGVVSWSTAANNAGGCGGLTGVTPLSRYYDWIVTTARQWGAGL
jgi:secreted trypsin-like serine protease